MANILAIDLLLLEANAPLLFYFFVLLIVAGVALTYFYTIRLGLLVTAMISGLLYYTDAFDIYPAIIGIIALIVLVIELVSVSRIEKAINNFISGIYLYYRVRKEKRKHR